MRLPTKEESSKMFDRIKVEVCPWCQRDPNYGSRKTKERCQLHGDQLWEHFVQCKSKGRWIPSSGLPCPAAPKVIGFSLKDAISRWNSYSLEPVNINDDA